MRAIGLMSGTSMDGVDVALVETGGDTIAHLGPVMGFPYDMPERQLIREAVEHARGLTRRDDRFGVLGLAEQMITDRHAQCVLTFLDAIGVDPASIDAVGFHGQTVVHKPEAGFTVQIGNGEHLARALNLRVVFDFRHADMQDGGQGAPLVPIFHRALALHAGLDLPAAFINIGGIANVTFVPDGGPENLLAFDAGPGNCLLDEWSLRHTGEIMDKDARLAMAGTVNPPALQALLRHPYFVASPPKSLDRHTFSLDPILHLSPPDGAATLTAFTVASIGAAVRVFPVAPSTWIISGGGAKNPHMFEGLKRVLPGVVTTADDAGMSSAFMEAQAFAYLAVRKLKGLPSSFPGTTGARGPVIAGRVAEPDLARRAFSPVRG
jgi:anhydro-N-acetylmuramic acid kinase